MFTCQAIWNNPCCAVCGCHELATCGAGGNGVLLHCVKCKVAVHDRCRCGTGIILSIHTFILSIVTQDVLAFVNCDSFCGTIVLTIVGSFSKEKRKINNKFKLTMQQQQQQDVEWTCGMCNVIESSLPVRNCCMCSTDNFKVKGTNSDIVNDSSNSFHKRLTKDYLYLIQPLSQSNAWCHLLCMSAATEEEKDGDMGTREREEEILKKMKRKSSFSSKVAKSTIRECHICHETGLKLVRLYSEKLTPCLVCFMLLSFGCHLLFYFSLLTGQMRSGFVCNILSSTLCLSCWILYQSCH